MSTVTIPNLTTATKADTSASPNTIALRDNNGVLTNLGEIIDGNMYTQTESVQVATVSTSKTLDGTAGVWLGSGTITLTLPTVASVGNGRRYQIFKTDSSNTITVNTSDSSTINGASSVTLTSQYQSRTFFTDGTNWFMTTP